MKLTNEWNRFIYRLWAPIYDETVNRLFMPGRRRALELLNLQAGERVLLVGVGTGEDLLLLPEGVEAVGIDLSEDMLRKARGKLVRCRAQIELIEGDAQGPLVEDETCDAAIFNLVLSVIPDGNECLRATLAALKPGARVVVFDKFLPEGNAVSPFRKLVNVFSTVLGTDINRRLSDVMKGCACEVVHEEPSIAGGMYRVVVLCKREGGKGESLTQRRM